MDHLTLRGAQHGGGQQYQYDALGRMSFRALQGEQSKVIAYSYDAAGRLTGSQHGDQAHRYALDAAGNRLDGQQALSDNRLGQLNGTRYRYDGAGNMIERQQPNGERLTMGYDGANRLVSLTNTATPRRPPTATTAWVAGSAKPSATPTAPPPPPTTAGTATASCAKKARASAQPSSTSRAALCPCCVLMILSKAK
ncbi:RHS repeat domain-containing protein [Halomonas sp. AOP43-A1-21]